MSRQTDTAAPEFPAPEVAEPAAALDAAVAAERVHIAAIEGSLKEHRENLARLLEARKTLARSTRAARRRGTTKTARTAFQRAGRGNVEKVRELLVHNGPTPKARLTETLAINDGTVTYALRHLEESGQVRATGEVVRGSKVYEYTSHSGRAVSRPGGRR